MKRYTSYNFKQSVPNNSTYLGKRDKKTIRHNYVRSLVGQCDYTNVSI